MTSSDAPACNSTVPRVEAEGKSSAPSARKRRAAFEGLLSRLSRSRREAAAAFAQANLFGLVYDNINFLLKIAEQILGRTDTQENGTCATIFPLFDARPEDMQTDDLLDSLDTAPPLRIEDILHTAPEARLFEDALVHTVLRTIVSSPGGLFSRFTKDVDASLPGQDDKIAVHKTDVMPLPAMHIDESSLTGNAEVIDTVFPSLGFDVGTTKFSGITRPVFGDQLSLARLRTLILNRSGHDTSANAYSYVVVGPGLFHHQMALTHGIMETHWGDPHTGVNDPNSLCYHNTVLSRKPIVRTSLPPYRTCRDLILTSLDGRVMHCLELVSECESLENYAANVTFAQLHGHARTIVERFASPTPAARLRRARHEQLEEQQAARASQATTCTETTVQESIDNADEPTITEGDMVFENAVLFMQDALVLREFNDAIKGGYSGRIIRALKILALLYRGAGRTKYAYELLHLLHNLTHVWPKPLRYVPHLLPNACSRARSDIIIKNWLVNPSGKPNSWVPVDLLQEHMNFWIKVCLPT